MRRRQPPPDPQFVTDLVAMFGVSTVEQAQKRIAEEDERFDVARELGLSANRHEPIIYYMRMDRLVKIGTTTNICARVSAVMPQGVLAVEPGDRRREQLRHRQFRAFHSHLEWFWLRETLWEYIVDLRARFEKAQGYPTEDWLSQHGVRRDALRVLDDQEKPDFT